MSIKDLQDSIDPRSPERAAKDLAREHTYWPIEKIELTDIPGADNKAFKVHFGKRQTVAEILRDLFLEIEHGDQEHRDWLKNKIEDFIKVRGYE